MLPDTRMSENTGTFAPLMGWASAGTMLLQGEHRMGEEGWGRIAHFMGNWVFALGVGAGRKAPVCREGRQRVGSRARPVIHCMQPGNELLRWGTRRWKRLPQPGNSRWCPYRDDLPGSICLLLHTSHRSHAGCEGPAAHRAWLTPPEAVLRLQGLRGTEQI